VLRQLLPLRIRGRVVDARVAVQGVVRRLVFGMSVAGGGVGLQRGGMPPSYRSPTGIATRVGVSRADVLGRAARALALTVMHATEWYLLAPYRAHSLDIHTDTH
jgi:hypothetical protein